MKASLKALLILFLASTLFSSCKECGEPTVTPITDSDAEWLVYKDQDTIRYTSNENEAVKFLLTNSFTENILGEGSTMSDDCFNKMDTQAGRIIQEVKQKWPGMATYIVKRPSNLKVSLVVQGSPGVEIDENNPTYSIREINGVNYQNVFEIKGDSTKVGDMKLALFNKEKGFIRVEYFGGKTLQIQ